MKYLLNVVFYIIDLQTPNRMKQPALKMPYAMAVRIRNTVIRFSLCKTVFRKSDAAFKAGL